MEGPRAAQQNELPAVIDLLNEIFRKPWGGDPNMGEYYRFVFNEDNLDNMRIFSDQGRPVAHIGYHMSEISMYGCSIGAGSIGAVCTLEEYRGQKLASRLLEDVMGGIEQQGGDIMIVSGGRGLYKRIGCIENGTGYRFMFLKGYTGKVRGKNITVSVCGDAAVLAPLRDGESVRYIRPLEEFQVMVDTGAVMNRPGEILLVSDGDAPLAYAVVILPEEDEKVASIVEYGGSRRALLDGIPIMFEKYALNGLTFDAAGWDLEMIYLLKTAGGTFGETDIPGTVKILNLERLAERIRPYIHGRIGRVESEKLSFSQNGDTYIFTDGKEELTAKGASSVHIVFGKKENDQWNVLEEGQLKDTLRKIFPLPRPWAGLNFV